MTNLELIAIRLAEIDSKGESLSKSASKQTSNLYNLKQLTGILNF